jgi:pimeloyl-ACP methyl ester carboxylesterase
VARSRVARLVLPTVKHAVPRGLRVTFVVLVVLAMVVAVFVAVGFGQQHKAEVAEAHRAPAQSQPHAGTPRDETDFRRFRIGSVAGRELTPNAQDFAARTVANGPLLLFFPATGSEPSRYQLFLSTAEDAGYHVLGLDYWNLGQTLSGTCTNHPHCYSQVQRNRFDGTASSSYSQVEPAGSITSRFRDAIAHLEKVDPAGGWSQFLASDGDIQWQNIVVAGHSQGGGMAAFIAHIRPVEGAIMFSSPVESDGQFHAAWMNYPGVTPTSREYAIDDVHDPFGPKIWGSWKVLGLDGANGPWRTTTNAPTGTQDPHAILSTYDFGYGGDAHSLEIDDQTPLDAKGTPKFLGLWHWLLTRFELPEVHGDDAATPAPNVQTPPPVTPTPSPSTTTPSTGSGTDEADSTSQPAAGSSSAGS